MTPAAISRPPRQLSDSSTVLLLALCFSIAALVVLGLGKGAPPCRCAEDVSDVRLHQPDDFERGEFLRNDWAPPPAPMGAP